MNKARLCIIIAVFALVTSAVAQTQRYNLGRPAIPEEIRELDISVGPEVLAYHVATAQSIKDDTFTRRSARTVTEIAAREYRIIPRSLEAKTPCAARTRCGQWAATGLMRRPCGITYIARCRIRGQELLRPTRPMRLPRSSFT